jgi:hypothetical protein
MLQRIGLASRDLWSGLYYALPELSDLAVMTRRMVSGEPAGSAMPIWSSALFGAACMGCPLWLFQGRDY